MTTDYIGHDLGLGGFNTDAVDLTDLVPILDDDAVAIPRLYFVVEASIRTIGNTITPDGRRLKVTGAITDGYRLDHDTGLKAVGALRAARRRAEDSARGVAVLPGLDGGDAPDPGSALIVDEAGTVLTDAEAEAIRDDRDPFADADTAAKEALADAAGQGPDATDDVPRWVEEADAAGQGPDATDEDLPVAGDAPSELAVAYVAWSWEGNDPLDATVDAIEATVDAQELFALWELDLLIDAEHRGAGRDDVLGILRGRRTAELALKADEEPWPGYAKAKVDDVAAAVDRTVAVADQVAELDADAELDLLGALDLLDKVERYETSHKARAGVLKLLDPARATVLAVLFKEPSS